jgi:hypothetical protein
MSISFRGMAITSAPLKQEMEKFGMDSVNITAHCIQYRSGTASVMYSGTLWCAGRQAAEFCWGSLLKHGLEKPIV